MSANYPKAAKPFEVLQETTLAKSRTPLWPQTPGGQRKLNLGQITEDQDERKERV